MQSRSNKLKRRVEEEKVGQRGKSLAETLVGTVTNGVPDDIWESADLLSPDDYETSKKPPSTRWRACSW